jgi:hypothetical protein
MSSPSQLSYRRKLRQNEDAKVDDRPSPRPRRLWSGQKGVAVFETERIFSAIINSHLCSTGRTGEMNLAVMIPNHKVEDDGG